MIKSDVVIATGMVSSVSSDKWKAPLASDFALCALKIDRDRFYIIIARLQPPHPLKEKFAFPIFFHTASVRASVFTIKVLQFKTLKHVKIVLDRRFYFQRQKIFSRG